MLHADQTSGPNQLQIWDLRLSSRPQAGCRVAEQRRDARGAVGGPGALQRQWGVGRRHPHRVRGQPGPQRAARLGRGRSRRVSCVIMVAWCSDHAALR